MGTPQEDKDLDAIRHYKGSVGQFKQMFDDLAGGKDTNAYGSPAYQGFDNVHPTRGEGKSPHWNSDHEFGAPTQKEEEDKQNENHIPPFELFESKISDDAAKPLPESVNEDFTKKDWDVKWKMPKDNLFNATKTKNAVENRYKALQNLLKDKPKELKAFDATDDHPAYDMSYDELMKWYNNLSESVNEAASVISMPEAEKVWDALVKKFSDNKNDSIEYLNKDKSYRNMAIMAIFRATKF